MTYLNFLAAGGGGIALLEVNPGLVIWTFIIFTIVLLLLRRFAWKPIVSAMDNRATRIQNDLKKAEKLRKEMEDKRHEYLKKLEALEEDVQKALKKAQQDGEAKRVTILAQAHEDASAMLKGTEHEIELAKSSAFSELKDELVRLSVGLVRQLLGRDLSQTELQSLAEESLKELKQLSPGPKTKS